MKKRIGIYVFLSPIGMLLLLSGLFSGQPVLSGILAGFGTIVLGFSAVRAVPLLARKEADEEESKIAWQDERNTVIREKAAWFAGMILIGAMGVSALVLALSNQLVGACVIAGLLLLFSLSILVFSAYFSKKL